MAKRKYSFDSKCKELAEHFCQDDPKAMEFSADLAETIQVAVEDWFSAREVDSNARTDQ